jgi:hypothetical protein
LFILHSLLNDERPSYAAAQLEQNPSIGWGTNIPCGRESVCAELDNWIGRFSGQVNSLRHGLY